MTEAWLWPAAAVLLGILACALLVALLALLYRLYRRYSLQVHVYCYSSRWRTLRWVATRPEETEDKDYDAFVSFAQGDSSFVTDHLVPFLESEERRFKLCLHYRDWVPGDAIPVQIIRSVRRSRRTIVVLSPRYLESVWAVMEFRTAYSAALSGGSTKVIVILYQDVGPGDKLSEELRAYLQMNTYVRWGSPWFWRQLVYGMPHSVRH